MPVHHYARRSRYSHRTIENCATKKTTTWTMHTFVPTYGILHDWEDSKNVKAETKLHHRCPCQRLWDHNFTHRQQVYLYWTRI